jgi:Ran GTPase-activating protein (RanGAP) involved in mRNA processing and transport
MGGKCRFNRGLLGRYHVVASKLLRAPWESWRNTEALAWLDGLHTTDVDSWFPRVASCPALEFINELHTCHLLQFGAETVAALARYERAPYLRSLGFRNADLTVDDALPLTVAPYWRQIRELNLSANKLGDRVGELLPFCTGLQSLNLCDNQIGAAGIEVLATSGHLSRLTELYLSDSPITTAGAKALAAAFPNLERLWLWKCNLGRAEVDALAQTGGWPRLRRLDLGNNKLTGPAVAALADSPLMDNVESLDLSFNHELTDPGLVALAAAPRCRNLVELDLQSTGVGDEGAQALLESPYVSKLAYLIVSSTRMGNGVKSRLRKRFGAGVRG